MIRPGDETHHVGYTVPPEIYDIAVGWDPEPEVERLSLLAGQAGVHPHSVLELGCGTGRLLRAFRQRVPVVCGIELSSTLAEWGRAHDRGEILVGDMSDFALGRQFDLIFSSANTIRHVRSDDAIAHMWSCIRAHLEPGGVFIADLQLGLADDAAEVGRPVVWVVARGQTEVRASWLVVEPPLPTRRYCAIEYTFEVRRGSSRGTWTERFRLRTYDAAEFVRLAVADGDLELAGLYEVRDPYLLETSVDKAVGRFLVVLRRLPDG